jgi:hypothetical protein
MGLRAGLNKEAGGKVLLPLPEIELRPSSVSYTVLSKLPQILYA